MTERQQDERSLSDLFAELARETSTLVRQEVDLVRTEMSRKAQAAGRHIGFIGAGGAVAYGGFLAVLAGVIVLFAPFLTLWGSSILFGLIALGGGFYLAKHGMDALRREDLLPRKTIETLKEDQEWTKDQIR